MLQLPPIPSWDGLHPLIIHFPIALLMVAPLFVLAGVLITPHKARPMLWSALILMVLGTASVFVSVETGEAAGKLAERSPEINAVLEHHEQLAERTRLAFSALTVVFAVLLLAPIALKRPAGRLNTSLTSLIFLGVYLGAMVLLVNTAHNGGRLVHELGVKAMMASPSGSPANHGD